LAGPAQDRGVAVVAGGVVPDVGGGHPGQVGRGRQGLPDPALACQSRVRQLDLSAGAATVDRQLRQGMVRASTKGCAMEDLPGR
jgi:hypothetical protein